MRPILLIFLTLSAISELQAQKIAGVYVGEILSPGNILVLNKGADVKGWLYQSETERMEFIGTYNNGTLAGTIKRLNGDTISIVEGKLTKDKLKLRTSHLGNVQSRSMYKVSSDSGYEIARLYAKDNDLALIGEWESLNREAELAEHGQVLKTYGINGQGSFRFLILAAKMKSTPVPPNFDPYGTFEFSWSISGDEITTERLRGPSIKNKYLIRGDTLIEQQRIRKQFYVRK